MDLTKEEYIKKKQKEYYCNKYKNKNVKTKFLKKINNDVNEDNFTHIYNAACRRIRNTIQNYNLKLKFSYNDMIGCNRDEFREYIINNLQEGMKLDNFGEWEMDHTIPISSFNFESLDEIKECFNYKNIKPMWKHENRVKYNKILLDNKEDNCEIILRRPKVVASSVYVFFNKVEK